MNIRSTFAIAALLSSFVLALPGCLVTSDTSESHSGAYVPQATFDQIEPGKTTAAFVKTELGEPTSKTGDSSDELWKYSYVIRKDSTGAVFLIFGGHDSKETPGNAFVEFKNGVVTNKWRS